MKSDYLTYRRAANVSLFGLALQVLLGAGLLIFSVLTKDHAAASAAAFAGFAALGWLALAIVYDQHRRERIEAMEAESLAASQTAASVFDATDAEFRVAAKRLAGLHKIFLPTVSLIIGLGLVGAGLALFRSGRPLIEPKPATDGPVTLLTTAPQGGWALGIGLFVAIVGFIFARYASGMAKQKAWGNLRGGAAGTVGTAILGLFIAIGHFVDTAGSDIVLRYLNVVIPAFMVLIGAEALLNSLLDVYRPRKAGEIHRPAFESRLLGFAAAPDRIAQSVSDAIAYQLGFDVTGSWFYRLLARNVAILALLGIVVVWLLSGLAVIRPHQRALVLRFGALDRQIGPGLHMKWPYPIETIEVPSYTIEDDKGAVIGASQTVTGVRSLDLGTPSASGFGPILWTNEHARDEVFQIVQPSSSEASSIKSEQARDLALVAVELPLQYSIDDVELFDRLAPAAQRDDLLRGIARRVIIQELSRAGVDDVLGSKRLELGAQIERAITAAFAQLNPGPDGKPQGAGIRVLSLGMTGVHPPKAVAPNFERVVEAQQNREAKIEAALMDQVRELSKVVGSVPLANKIVGELNGLESLRDAKATEEAVRAQEFKVQQLLQEAGGSAAALISSASAERWQKHMDARGRSARYAGQLAAFRNAPAFYMSSLYFDALKSAVANSRLYVTTDKNLHVRWELQDRDTGVDIFKPTGPGGDIE
jgi:modulator of FtsH protease HflK